MLQLDHQSHTLWPIPPHPCEKSNSVVFAPQISYAPDEDKRLVDHPCCRDTGHQDQIIFIE